MKLHPLLEKQLSECFKGTIPEGLDMLMEKISNEYVQLEQRLEHLQNLNDNLNQFSAVISHDLKAPLRAVSSIASWIDEDTLNSFSDESKQNFGLMKEKLLFLENLINGILKYSKAGRNAPAETFDSGQVIRETIAMLNCGPGISFRFEGTFPTIKMNKTKFTQVIMNLVSNAVRHHNKQAAHIIIGAMSTETHIQFFVSDDGPGIDSAFHDSIFQMFRPVKTGEQNECSGIGLAITRKIVEDAGGKIWVESKPGSGSKFVFTLSKLPMNNEIKITNYGRQTV